MKFEEAEAAANKIAEDLAARNGLGDEWEKIDEKVKDDIKGYNL